MSRRNRESEIELLKAFAAGDQYFVVVSVCRSASLNNFRFATSSGGFAALKNMFEMRPFDSLPGANRRFFFSAPTSSISAGQEKADKFGIVIFIDEGSKTKQFEIDCPKDLMQNLLWFQQLRNDDANHLRADAEPGGERASGKGSG